MIYYPKTYATCAGANRAINMAYKIKNEYNKTIYIYKEILHNEYVINELKRNGIICIDDLSLLNKDDILIIRAHGESKKTYDELDKLGIKYYDATCKNVCRIHDLVINKSNEGYTIIIVGKKNHPEVIGTSGWCNDYLIIENEDDYKSINKSKKYFVVCQTTIGYKKVSDLLNYLNINNINYEFENTICNLQSVIQSSSCELASQMNLMFVIGGKKSSNTHKLYNLVLNECESYLFSDLEEFYEYLKTSNIKSNYKIGFTAGASTSKRQVFDFSNFLEFYLFYKDSIKSINNYFKKNNIKIDLNEEDYLLIISSILGYSINKQNNKSISLGIAILLFKKGDILSSLKLLCNEYSSNSNLIKIISYLCNNDNINIYDSFKLGMLLSKINIKTIDEFYNILIESDIIDYDKINNIFNDYSEYIHNIFIGFILFKNINK